MKKILLDISPLCESNLTGIGTYSYNLTQQILKKSKNMAEVFDLALPLSRIKHLKKIEKIFNYPIKLISPLHRYTNYDYEIVHGLDFKIKFNSTAKKIITIHDMATFEYGILDKKFATDSRINFTRFLLESHPEKIICVSNFTKKRFLHFFPQFEQQTSVVYLGCDHLITPNKFVHFNKVKNEQEDPYILYVGTIEKRKNIEFLLNAFNILKKNKSELQLKIAGKIGYQGHDIISKIKSHPFRDKITYYGYQTQAEIKSLYERARVFVYPSKYEGFGLPVLEAMRQGIPVVGLKDTAVAEISNGAAFLVDSKYPEMMGFAIRRAHEDESCRKALITLGLQNVSSFTWSNCFNQTLQCYNELGSRLKNYSYSFSEHFNVI